MPTVTVIGIGRLGLCLALNLERAGYDVVGLDINEDYVAALNNRRFESSEPGVNQLLRGAVTFRATASVEAALSHSDVVFVTLPTTSLPDGRFDHSAIDSFVHALEASPPAVGSADFADLVICSNVNPGYCDELAARLESLRYRVTYAPELVAQGTILHDQTHPGYVVIGGANPTSGARIAAIYERMTAPHHPTVFQMTRRSAELFKLSLNCYLTLKISFANMIGDLAIQAGADPEQVLKAVGADSRVGSKYFEHGFGYGGPCLTRTNRAFAWHAVSHGIDPGLALAADTANTCHLQFQIEQFTRTHGTRDVCFPSVTYKPGVTLIEGSQRLAFAVALAKRGYRVTIKDEPSVLQQVEALHGLLFTYEPK